MKKKRFLILSAVLVLGFFFSSKSRPSDIKIPVDFSYSFLKPLVDVEIEGNTYSLLVDLGSMSNELTLEKHILEKIKAKKKLEPQEIADAKGNSYSCSKFCIPKMQLGSMNVFNSNVIEQNPEFLFNTLVWEESNSAEIIKNRNLKIDGKIGFSLFKNYNCLFDFPNCVISLQNHSDKFSTSNYVPIPFSLEDCGIVLSVETDEGVHKMVLDTGATFSVISQSAINNSSLIEVEKGSKKWYYPTKKLIIGSVDYGSWELALFNVSKELNIDGCLGADFFLEHAIYLDFEKNIAYIQMPEKSILKSQWKRFKTRAIQLYRKSTHYIYHDRYKLCTRSLDQSEESTEVNIEISWDFKA